MNHEKMHSDGETEGVNASFSREQNNIELLKSYKELLDQGIITQEDYDAKKQELLAIKSPATPARAETVVSAPAPAFEAEAAEPTVTSPKQPEKMPDCPHCGAELLTPDQEICPYCKTPVKAKRKLGMKWNKFLSIICLITGIYFILNAAAGVILIPTSCQDMSEYGDGLGFLGIGALCVSIPMIWLCFSTKNGLDWNRKKGPRLVFVFLNVDVIYVALIVVIYCLMGGAPDLYEMLLEPVVDAILDGNILRFLVNRLDQLTMLAFGAAVFIGWKALLNIPHIIYYRKRKHVFIY